MEKIKITTKEIEEKKIEKGALKQEVGEEIISEEDIEKREAGIKAQDEEELVKQREKVKEITGEREKVKPEELMPELGKTIIETAEKERKEVEKLKEKVEKIKEVLEKAKWVSTIEELDQLEKEAGEVTKEGERLISGIGILHAFRERLMRILGGGEIEKEKIIGEESERLKKEAEVSMKSRGELKEFFEKQRRRIEKE